MKTLAFWSASLRHGASSEAFVTTAPRRWPASLAQRTLVVAAAAVAAIATTAHAQSLKIQLREDNPVLFGPSITVPVLVQGFSPAKVDVYVDGVWAASDSAPPFELVLATVSEGQHRLEARATHAGSPVKSDELLVEVLNPTASKLSLHDFVSQRSSWAYADDVFRGTAQPKYARAFPHGGIELGAVDEADINRMSAGYVTTVNLKTTAHVQLRLAYDLSVASAFENDERFEVLAAVDGVLKGLNGQDYIHRASGPFLQAERVSVPLGRLSAGPHRIAVGGYLSKKTEKAELATLYLDWLSVETLPAANVLPVVNITSPVDGAHYPAGQGPDFIELTATDGDGSIERVELYSNERFINPIRLLTEPPYRFPGYHSSGFNRLFVRAFDDRGAARVDSVTFVVGAVENQSPRANYTSPEPGEFVKLGSTLRVSGDASDADGTIERVEVYLEDVLQGTDYTAPYSVDVSLAGLPEGAYGLRLVPWDNEGAANGAIETYFQIVANLPPIVTMTSPVPETIFNKGATVRVRVAAADADGSVTRVELEVDGGQIQLTDTSAPYEFAVTGLAPGEHFLRARAVDNLGRPSEAPADASVHLGVIVSAGNGQVTPPSSGGGFYYNRGETVTFTANPAPTGYAFDQWIGETDFLANPFAATTTLKVPTGQTSRSSTATYKPTTNPTILRFVLINAETDLPIPGYDPFYNGAVLNLAQLPTRHLNVRAVTTPEPTGSVHFALDAGVSGAKQNVENVTPYAFALDDLGNYRRWTPSAGKHTLTAWAYTAQNKGGMRSQPLTINFTVIAP